MIAHSHFSGKSLVKAVLLPLFVSLGRRRIILWYRCAGKVYIRASVSPMLANIVMCDMVEAIAGNCSLLNHDVMAHVRL
jgi:hypothetical protein